MQHFIIWPILVPAIAFCYEDTQDIEIQSPKFVDQEEVTKDSDC